MRPVEAAGAGTATGTRGRYAGAGAGAGGGKGIDTAAGPGAGDWMVEACTRGECATGRWLAEGRVEFWGCGLVAGMSVTLRLRKSRMKAESGCGWVVVLIMDAHGVLVWWFLTGAWRLAWSIRVAGYCRVVDEG